MHLMLIFILLSNNGIRVECLHFPSCVKHIWPYACQFASLSSHVQKFLCHLPQAKMRWLAHWRASKVWFVLRHLSLLRMWLFLEQKINIHWHLRSFGHETNNCHFNFITWHCISKVAVRQLIILPEEKYDTPIRALSFASSHWSRVSSWKSRKG